MTATWQFAHFSQAETRRNPGDLDLWLQQAGLLAPGTPDPAAAAVLASGRRLRQTVDRAVLAAADGRLPASSDVAMLNRAAAEAPGPPCK
ncbi:ABATE domain-containing protein [Streptomyces sp. NPDC054813]